MMKKEKKYSPRNQIDNEKSGGYRFAASSSRSLKRRGARLLVLLLTFAMLFPGAMTSVSADSEFGDSMYRSSLDDIKSLLTSDTFTAYLQSYKDAKDAEDEIKIDVTDLVLDGDNATDATFKVVDKNTGLFKDSQGNAIDVLVTGDDGMITFNFDVAKAGMYSIEVTYYTGDVFLYTCTDCEPGIDEDCPHTKGKECSACGETQVFLVHSEAESSQLKTVSAEYKCPGCGTVNYKVEGSNTNVHTNVMYSKSSKVERAVLIDGVVPYREARSVELTKAWADNYYNKEDPSSPIRSDSDKFFDTVNTTDDRLFREDTNGNESRPDKTLVEKWESTFLHDASGYFDAPLKFYFDAGRHTISFKAIRELLAISSITLKASKEVSTYEEYLEKHKDVQDVSKDVSVKIQAEFSKYTSGKTIYQINDRTSVVSEPQDASKIRYNEIGGDKWQYVGQWIEWDVEVPEDGMYYIIPRSKQSYYAGMFVSRKLYIDGEVPFKEAQELRFNHSESWQAQPLTDGTTEFKFYLSKGKHTIRMDVSLGGMSEILSTIEASLSKINGYYRKILMVTGPSPDTYRDYGFERSMPDVIRGLKAQSELLYDISKKLEDTIGYKGDHSVILDKAAYILETMGNYPSKIAANMSQLKSQIGAIGTWLTTTQNQPLDIDYFVFQSAEAPKPEAEAGFFRSLWGEIVKFFMSFFSDFTNIGSFEGEGAVAADEDASVQVWLFTSRDQAQIIRNLVDNDFASKYPGVGVNVKLVTADTLLPAVLAGTGPDVALGLAQSTPINYAIRSAVMALNVNKQNADGLVQGYDFTKDENGEFSNLPFDVKNNPTYSGFYQNVDGFNEVVKRFSSAALVPFTLYGETFAIPETMSFSMLFYRKDIFAELGINVPETWDQFYDTIYTLYSNNLEIGFPHGVPGSTILMYQQGDTMYDQDNQTEYMKYFGEDLVSKGHTYDAVNETLYDQYIKEFGSETQYIVDHATKTVKVPKTDGMTINLDSDIALSTFKQVCQLYTMYSFPVSYDFANRFRTGEMPMAVADYTAYNQLIVFAPEINGLWEFTTLPGTITTEGNKVKASNTSVAAVSGMIMLKGVDQDNAFSAWTFMQWWSSKDIQSAYGNEIEALLGPSAKYNTANIEALYDMPWSKSEYDNLSAQFKALTCTPEFPGGYIITRYSSFAFLSVYNNGDEPVKTLQSYITQINNELTRKREEFNLPTADDYDLEKAKQKEGK